MFHADDYTKPDGGKQRRKFGIILPAMKKAIITVVGKDVVGIIAKTATHLAKSNINILDISQTVVQDYFNMMMIVDLSKSKKPFDKVASELAALGTELGLEVRCQKSEIFEKMHRV